MSAAKEFIIQWQGFNPVWAGCKYLPYLHLQFQIISSNIYSRIKLSTIELSIFNGNYNLWIKFRDTFKSLIHNNDALTNIENFHYLIHLSRALERELYSFLAFLKITQLHEGHSKTDLKTDLRTKNFWKKNWKSHTYFLEYTYIK